MHIAVIGAGWNGCHIALQLAARGHKVVLLERDAQMLNGVSGNFGIRLHKGPHYPRSEATREACRATLDRFRACYPELVVEHDYAVYAQGSRDAMGLPSKVTNQAFADVCHESPECRQLDLEAWGFTGLEAAYNLDEPSAVLGGRLRDHLRIRLAEAGVEVRLGCRVLETVAVAGGHRLVLAGGVRLDVQRVINATGYQALVPPALDEMGLDMQVVYQVCLGLHYQDSRPAAKPISFIVMDGWFPCLMPRVETHESNPRNYVLTHGSYTILGSFATVEAAEALLETLDDGFVEAQIRPRAEQEMCRFWSVFLPRFSYTGWKGVVLAKMKTRSEFRSSVVFEQGGLIHVFPGKITNVLQAADEVLALLADQQCREHGGFRYVEGGVLDRARQEIRSKPLAGEQNTANLQTYELFRAPDKV